MISLSNHDGYRTACPAAVPFDDISLLLLADTVTDFVQLGNDGRADVDDDLGCR